MRPVATITANTQTDPPGAARDRGRSMISPIAFCSLFTGARTAAADPAAVGPTILQTRIFIFLFLFTYIYLLNYANFREREMNRNAGRKNA